MKTEKFGILLVIVVVLLIFALAMAARAQEMKAANEAPPLSGGTFTISKTVIAGGGAEMQNQSRAVQSTAGQTIAGGTSIGGAFSLKSGFWTPDNFAPTAAAVTVGGRVVTAQGRGIRNVSVTILFPTGESRTILTGTFGYYHFSDVEAGSVYVLTVSGKRFVFIQPTQVLTINEDRDDVNFAAAELYPKEKY